MTSKIIYLGDLRCESEHLQSGTKIFTDAPTDNHGKGEVFSPTDLCATSLAQCMLTTIAILGKDKFGRSVYERLTQKSDAEAKLKSHKLDPNLFENLVMKQNEAQYTSRKEDDDIGTINYYKASRQLTEGEFE